LNANGGNGGSQSILFFHLEAEGPGGGGGGGYIAVSNGSPTRNTNGGNNGTTNSTLLTEFPPNGATRGGPGINNGSLNAFKLVTQTVNLCASGSTTLTFTTNGTVPPGTTFYWFDQPTGGTAVGTGPTFTTPTLTASKTYYVTTCPGTVRVPIQVNVSNTLAASFLSNVVCANTPTIFAATGSATINSWSWDFGDGTGTSTIQNPSYSYSTGGTYTVTLTVSDGSCTSTITQTAVVNNAPVVNFTSTASSSGCGPLNVQFTNTTTNATTYSWNFGDGSPASTATNPSHTYSSSGTYTVTLTAGGSGCTLTNSHTYTVGPPPLASFTANNICQSDTLVFNNLSNGNGSTITSYDWDFDDGSPNSTAVNPSHFYSSPGTYNVTLTVTTALCTDDTVITVSVSPGPVVNFNASTLSGCAPLNVNFSNTTTGSPNFTWNFGDGSATSSSANPTHVYNTPGTYSVTLIATQGSCADTMTFTNMIQVANIPQSSFSVPASVCIGDSVLTTNSSNGNGSTITSYSWDFGDGSPVSTQINPNHYYSTTGTYTIMLTVGTATCTDDTSITVSVNPAPTVNFASSVTQACDSATVQFTNTSSGAISYSWTFGDGATSSSSNPSHIYTSPGSYTVMLTANASGGCSTSRAVFNMVNIHATPLATFTATSNSICINECIGFDSQFPVDVTTWSWTFSNATPATAAVPDPGTICYSALGDHDVSLTVSNGFCTSTHIETVFIHVVDCSTIPTAGFISSDTILCNGNCVNYVDLSSNATTWQWSFPGATPSTSTIENPTNICYPAQGVYNVTLIAGNLAGYDTLVYNNFIQVTPAPSTPNFTVSGNVLTSTPAPQYQWYYNNIPISGATSQQFTAMLSGEYYVEIIDVNGCSAFSAKRNISLVGIEEADNKLLFYIYPNPATDEISILLHSEVPMKINVKLYDAIGREIFAENLSMTSVEETFKYNLKTLVQGIYFFEIKTNSHKWVRPVIKQ
jgi:PKD repeat protein